MNRINEFNVEPGTYEHHKGGLYVVTGMLTHVEGPEGKMITMEEPLVLFRDLEPIQHDVNGKITSNPLRIYGHKLSEFRMDMDGKPRFKLV